MYFAERVGVMKKAKQFSENERIIFMKRSEEPKKTFGKIQSDNHSSGDMSNIDFGGDFHHVKQYVDNIVKQVHVQTPSPETDIEQLIKSLQTNRMLLIKYREVFEDSVIEDGTIDDLKIIAVIRNIVTAIKNIEMLIPNITFKGGMAEFKEGESDPVRLLMNIIARIGNIKNNIIVKEPKCPHCFEEISTKNGYKNLILSVKPSPKRLFFYCGCKPIETVNDVKVSSAEKHTCKKCNKPFCLYIASKRSLVEKIKDAKIADKT
jgi:hypothetical protein